MIKFFFVLALIFSSSLFAQDGERGILKSKTILFHIGPSFHGSGDIRGISYGISGENNFSKNWFWSFSFDGNLNDTEQLPFIFEDPNGNLINSTLHNVIAGFQLTPGLGYRFINKKHHRLAIHPGIFLRYQASSLNDVETTLFPIITDFPIPIRIIENFEKGNTWSVGGVVRFQYDYLIKSKYLLGIQGGWQTDTNGDAISHLTLRFGYSF